MTALCSTYQRKSRAKNNSFCTDSARSNQIFPVTCLCAGSSLSYVEAQLRLGEEEGGHFFKLHPQRFRNFDVHFSEMFFYHMQVIAPVGGTNNRLLVAPFYHRSSPLCGEQVNIFWHELLFHYNLNVFA